jgi:hypothetical protein
MSIKEDKILLPEEVRKILNADNKEIVDLCKQTSVLPKKNKEGQLYFSLDEVKRLKRAKESKTAVTNVVTASGDSQAVVNNLLSTLKSLENNLASSVEKVIDDKLEGIDDLIIEFVRCKTENESLKNKINELNKENFNLKMAVNSFKPVMCGLYVKKEDSNNNILF